MSNNGLGFERFLGELRDGTFVLDASDALAELVESVRQTGRAGRLTLTFDIAPASKGASGMVNVTDAIIARAPRPERRETFMYALEGGALSRRDPRQPRLPLEEGAS